MFLSRSVGSIEWCFPLLVTLVSLTPQPTLAQRVPLIVNGSPTDDYPAVGIVGEVAAGGFCTGTLISPHHVLTAAHCAEFLLDLGGAQTGTFTVAGRTYMTSSVEIIDSYNSRNFTNDVAILVLSEPVLDVVPLPISTVSPQVGDEVTIVGFGGMGTPSQGSDGSFGTKSVGATTIDGVTETEFFWLFDELTESNPAPGDSGGPVLVTRDGVTVIAGIVSSGTQATPSWVTPRSACVSTPTSPGFRRPSH